MFKMCDISKFTGVGSFLKIPCSLLQRPFVRLLDLILSFLFQLDRHLWPVNINPFFWINSTKNLGHWGRLQKQAIHKCSPRRMSAEAPRPLMRKVIVLMELCMMLCWLLMGDKIMDNDTINLSNHCALNKKLARQFGAVGPQSTCSHVDFLQFIIFLTWICF